MKPQYNEVQRDRGNKFVIVGFKSRYNRLVAETTKIVIMSGLSLKLRIVSTKRESENDRPE